MNVMDRIIDVMEKSNITVAELCRTVGISDGNFGNWKRRNSIPSTSIIMKIAECLNVSPNYLLIQ